MDCSLFNRLYGGCLGLVFGEMLALHQLENEPLPRSPRSALPLQWMTALIEAGRWDLSVAPPDLLAPPQQFPSAVTSGAELAIATLPIAFYFHHDLRQQRHYLWNLDALKQADPDTGHQVMVFAYVLAQALRGQLVPQTLVPQILAYLNVVRDDPAHYPDPTEAFVNQLNQLKLVLSQPFDLAIAADQLRHYPTDPTMAICLLTFLGSPAHWHLTLSRSLKMPNVTASAVLLLGVLAGAYNGALGIPPHLSGYLHPHFTDGRFPYPLQQLAAQFLALWAGVLCIPNRAATDWMPLAVTGPGLWRSPVA